MKVGISLKLLLRFGKRQSAVAKVGTLQTVCCGTKNAT